jgi:adenylate cyclase
LQVLDELHRILARGLSGASERQRGLLRYLVTEEIEGRGARVKAYSIATDVLGRSADFDAQLDSIVRVEIGRLRQALERHYLASGPGPNLSISIPKGQYRPVFNSVSDLPAPARSARAWGRRPAAFALAVVIAVAATAGAWLLLRGHKPAALRRGPLVAVAPVEFTADRDEQAYVGAGLQAELAAALSEFDWLSVAPLTAAEAQRLDRDPRSPKADFLLRSTIRLVNDRVAAAVLLLDGRDGALRWSKSYDVAFSAHDVFTMQRDIAAKVGADVGNPFGIIARIERTRMDDDEFKSDEAFRCELRALGYWAKFSQSDYLKAKACFESIRDRKPPDANSLAALSLLIIDPSQQRFAVVPPQATLDAASGLAQQAYQLDDQALLPRVARYTAALCAGDLETFRRLGKAVTGDYPNNPVALTNFGARLLLGADDAEGWALLQRARELSANLMPVDHAAAVIRALGRNEAPDLSGLRDAAFETDAPIVSLLYFATAAARGDSAEVLRARTRIRQLGLEDAASAQALVDAQCWSAATKKIVAEAVAKAF